MRETIFERYRRGAGSAARPGGTGLGLAIVRDLVALHNGMVTLTDAPEGGALFVVDLPLNLDGGADGASTGALPTIDVAERQRATVERLRAELDADGRRDAPAPGRASRAPIARASSSSPATPSSAPTSASSSTAATTSSTRPTRWRPPA